MASETENYNQAITTHLESIDNNRLLKIANDVSNFTKNYNNYIKKQQQQDSYFKQISSESASQSKALNKMLEESIDSKKSQKEFQKKQEQYSEKMRETNQSVIKGLSDISRSTEDNVKNVEKLNRLTAEVQKENAQARLQDLIKDNKRFKLESKYWKDLTGGIKGMASEFHDFKKNPGQWMSEAMGDLLGKALDKSVDALKTTLDAGFKSIAKGFGDLKNSIFDMMADQKRRAESLAQEFNRDYLEASGALNRSNAAVAMLAQRGELDISRTSKHVDTITSKLLRRFGDELKDMSQDEYNKYFKEYAQLINAGAADKIDEIEEIAAGNEKLMSDMIKAETQLAGIRSRQDLRIQKGMEAVIITAEEAHKLGITYEQSVRANEKNQIFIAKVLASNKELGVEEVRAFTNLQKTLMSKDFVTNVLDDQNINLSQLIGIDSNTAKKILTSGSDKERLDFMNRIIKSGAYNEIPALKKMMEELGFDPMTLNVLSKQGALKIDDESIKKITDAQNTDFQKFNAVLLSSGSKINEEIRTRISMLSAEGIRDRKGNLTPEGKIQLETLKEFNTFEDLFRNDVVKQNEEDIKRAKELYDLIKDSSKGDARAIQRLASLSEADQKLANDILNSYQKNEKLVKDQVQISQTLSEAQDLGLDKALSGGGLQGLFSGLLDVGMKSAYSPEYQEKLGSFMDNIKKSIEPAVNVFKELLIDPILDSLHDIIGGLLGDILVSVKKISSKITGSDYSEEQQNYDRFKFTTAKERVLKDIDKVKQGRTVGSEDYMSMLSDVENISQQSIESNVNLSRGEKNKLLMYKSMTSSGLNSGGQILGASKISSMDLSDDFTRQKIQDMMSRIYFEGDLQNGKIATRGAENLNQILQNSSSLLFNDPEEMIEFLSVGSGIDKSKLKSVYETLDEHLGVEFGGDLNEIFGLSRMGGVAGAKYSAAKKVMAAYLLLQSGYDLLAKKSGVGNFYELVPHNPKADNHLQFRSYSNLFFGEPDYFANGGVVGATKGGQHIVLGEAGHDEIVIPTDPAKRERAQELLRLAEENYGLYSQSPDSITGSLQQKLEELLFDIRILMIQLDPMRDVLASQALMSAMGLLKNIKATNAELDSAIEEESGGDTPLLGSPIQGAPGMDAIRKRIIDQALEMSGKPYGTLPKGVPTPPSAFVCNQLVNWAYSHALGAKNYAELLGATKLSQMNTVSGFIDAVGKNYPKAILARSVAYSDLNGIAKPGDMIFTGDRATLQSPYNPDKHGHTGLYISNTEWIDASSWMVKGKQLGVGVHTPRKEQKYMLMNFLDQMPLSWYESKGLLSASGIEDESTLTSHMLNMSYDPALQSIPDASGVSSQVDRANKAKIESEKRKVEEKQNSFVRSVKEIAKNLGTNFSDKVSKPVNFTISDDKVFCTTGQQSCSPASYGVG